jgi:hypothetical protein
MSQPVKRGSEIDMPDKRFPHGLLPALVLPFLKFPHGIAHQPQHRWPEPDENCPPFGVTTLVLIDGFGADPQRQTQTDRAQRGCV